MLVRPGLSHRILMSVSRGVKSSGNASNLAGWAMMASAVAIAWWVLGTGSTSAAQSVGVAVVVSGLIICFAFRRGTPARRLVSLAAMAAGLTLLQAVSLFVFAFWVTPAAALVFPLLVAAAAAAFLAVGQRTRGYAFAVVLGTLNGAFAAFIFVATGYPMS
jgi:hypothetical protein